MIPKVELKDLIDLHKNNTSVNQTKLVNIRGCNGSGKSTIPILMLETDPYSFEVTWRIDRKERTIATVFPSYQYLALGHYHSKCGGMDSIKTTDEIKLAVKTFWNLNYNILMEGVLASTVRQTYIDLFKGLNESNDLKREIIMYNLLPPLQVCLERIQLRNGGKPIKEQLVADKWGTVEKNIKYFESTGFKCLRVSNDGINRSETLDWFFNCLGEKKPVFKSDVGVSISKTLSSLKNSLGRLETEQKPKVKDKEQKSKDQKIKALPKYSGEAEELYIPKPEEISGHEWEKYYKEPSGEIVINWNNMRYFWYWIAERMNIWHKRTILKQPQPWTEDEILREGKFTNAIRDLDRGTVIYLNEILKKIDEPCEDIVKRQKEIILNTMVYRLFIRKETWDCIGFLELDNWDTQWTKAKEKLRKRRESGEQIFHGAYYVNDLHAASPHPDNHDKTENAINLIESFWYPRLDEIYIKATTLDMKGLLSYLTTLCCVGGFTAYEWVCDWCMCHRHTTNKIMDWTDDSFVNIGPGNKKGLNFIFEKSGNLSDIEKDIYLRATWKHYMKRYGFYDEFIKILPDWMNGDINLRVIEHDLCELQKYLSVLYGVGKLKGKFMNESRNNLDCLVI